MAEWFDGDEMSLRFMTGEDPPIRHRLVPSNVDNLEKLGRVQWYRHGKDEFALLGDRIAFERKVSSSRVSWSFLSRCREDEQQVRLLQEALDAALKELPTEEVR